MSHLLQVSVVLLAAVVGSVVGLFVWHSRDTAGARPLAAFMLAASVWSLAEGLALASAGFEWKVFWTRVVWSVSPILPLAWLATVLTYTGRERELTRRRLVALGVEPLAFLGLLWTNDAHHLVFESTRTVTVNGGVVLVETFGLAFWGHLVYSYGLIAVGALLLVRWNFRTNRLFRSQGTALLVVIFVPLVANVLTVFHLLPPLYDLTSVGFVLSGVVIVGAILDRKLMAVAPAMREIGRETLIDELDDQVLIVDGDDRVVDVNPAAETLFDVDREAVVGDALESVEADLADVIDDLGDGQLAVELATDDGVRYFDARVTPLYRGHGVAGRLVSLRDVTERQHREQRLDVLNRLLRHNLRNEMNVVRGNAELVADALEDADDAIIDRLERVRDTVDTVVDRSDKVGRLSQVIDADRTADETVDLAEACASIADSVTRLNPETDVELDVPGGLVVESRPAVRFAVEELLTNAVEHTDREEPSVRLSARRGDDFVTVEVTDDGPGIPEQERRVIESGSETDLRHGSGIGLWLVAWVVRACGGRIGFENHAAPSAGQTDGGEPRGCTVRLQFPAPDPDDAADGIPGDGSE